MPKFYWWNGTDLVRFFAKVMRIGLANVRIEFHPDSGLLYVRNRNEVARANGEDDEGFNFVKTCPPDCPD